MKVMAICRLSPMLGRSHLLATIAAFLLMLSLWPEFAASQVQDHSRAQMGTQVQVLVWTPDDAGAAAAAERAFAEIERIESLMSEWRNESEISRVNREATAAAVPVGPDLYKVLSRGVEIGKASGGAFDISWAAFRGVWDFKTQPPALPDPTRVAQAVGRVDYRKVVLDAKKSTVRLGLPGMALGLGGIAKGYAVDRAAAVLIDAGFSNFVVSAGGDMLTRGSKAGQPWIVGVQHPRAEFGVLLARVASKDEAVVTSGDYERYFMVGEKRYHHILDVRTGQPARGAMSVTVLSRNAMDADALATAAFVLGPKKGLALLEQHPGVEGLIVDSRGEIQMTGGARARINIVTPVDRTTP